MYSSKKLLKLVFLLTLLGIFFCIGGRQYFYEGLHVILLYWRSMMEKCLIFFSINSRQAQISRIFFCGKTSTFPPIFHSILVCLLKLTLWTDGSSSNVLNTVMHYLKQFRHTIWTINCSCIKQMNKFLIIFTRLDSSIRFEVDLSAKKLFNSQSYLLFCVKGEIKKNGVTSWNSDLFL